MLTLLLASLPANWLMELRFREVREAGVGERLLQVESGLESWIFARSHNLTVFNHVQDSLEPLPPPLHSCHGRWAGCSNTMPVREGIGDVRGCEQSI